MFRVDAIMHAQMKLPLTVKTNKRNLGKHFLTAIQTIP